MEAATEKHARRHPALEERTCHVCGKTHRRGIGGSSMGAILGISPWRNALDVYHDLTRPRPEDEEERESIDLFRGNHLEADVARWYFDRTGRSGRRWPGGVLVNPDWPAFVAHPDYELFSDDEHEGSGVLEVKSPRAKTMTRVYDRGLRQSEIVQLHVYTGLSGRTWGEFGFGSLEHEAGPVLPVPVDVDPDLSRWLFEIGQRFWDEHVVPMIPPDPDEWRLLEDPDAPSVYETTGQREDVEDADAARMARELIEAKELKDRGESLYKERKGDLQRWMEQHLDTDRARVPGVAKLTIVRNEGRTSFSRTAIAGHRPVNRDALLNAALRNDADWLLRALEEGALDLDLDLFVRKGDPYSYLLPTADKEKGE